MHHHPQPEKIELISNEFDKIEPEVKASNLSIKHRDVGGCIVQDQLTCRIHLLKSFHPSVIF